MSAYRPTPIDQIAPAVASLRKYHLTGKPRTLEWRRAQLMALYNCCKENEAAFHAAVSADVGVEENQVFLRASALVYNEISTALNNLSSWTAPEYPSVPLINKLDQPQVRSEPKGTVLIIGAWNYPYQLTIAPLVGALAAGCCAVIKPSELSEKTAMLIAELLPKYLDTAAFCVINGAIPETTEVLAQRFDHILYTGNSQVARIVSAAAAKNLTPVTLELGGKSPALVDENVDLSIVARRIAWGAMMNCGQTCVRVDYVMVRAAQVDALVAELKTVLAEFYGASYTEGDKRLGTIINDRHYARVCKLLDETKGRVVVGGERKADARYLSPTVVTGCDGDDALMAGEIFGPIIPIMAVESVDAMIEYVNAHDKPLALYVFTNSDAVAEHVLSSTSSGGALVNDVLMHCTVEGLPFGGIGESGQGAYHGKYSFDMFSHKKAVMKKKLGMESANDLRYPPATDKKMWWLKKLAVSEPKTSWFPFW